MYLIVSLSIHTVAGIEVRVCPPHPSAIVGEGAASSCSLGVPRMGAQMLGSASDNKTAFPPLYEPKFSSFILQKGSISWSHLVSQQSVTCTDVYQAVG